MIRFPKEFPDKLRSSILPSEVIAKKVKLKSRGKEFSGLCPFHNEKTPSFTVNDQKGFYHCFGCQAHGDIISFVMDTEGLEYPEAVNQLADDFGIPIPKTSFNPVKEEKIARNYQILEDTCQFFEKNLDKNATFYLNDRGISNNNIKKFRLGFSQNSFDSLTNFLKSKNYSEQEMLATGIIGKNSKGNIYDKLRNRIVFPILDKKNRVIAYGGRTLGDDLPKYLNSAETELFKKNQTLYNISFARKEIFQQGYAVAVEGYMDAISLSNNGLKNVVASLGTALGELHLKELFYITDKIVICLDGDSAGTRAAKRVSEIVLPLVNAKKNISFAFLPNKMDPDDFIREFGAKALEKLFIDATPLSESLFEFALMELKINKNNKISAENKAKIEGLLSQKIDMIKDNSTKKYFSQFFRDLLFLLGRKSKKTPKLRGFGKKIHLKKPSNLSDNIAKNIIALIIANPDLATYCDDDFDTSSIQFTNDKLTTIKEIIVEFIENNDIIDRDSLFKTLENQEFNSYIKEIRNILISLKDNSLESDKIKFRILLMKDLLIQVEQQYKESLGKIDEIETHQTAIIDQKIKEIFDYKNTLEQKIMILQKELI